MISEQFNAVLAYIEYISTHKYHAMCVCACRHGGTCMCAFIFVYVDTCEHIHVFLPFCATVVLSVICSYDNVNISDEIILPFSA